MRYFHLRAVLLAALRLGAGSEGHRLADAPALMARNNAFAPVSPKPCG